MRPESALSKAQVMAREAIGARKNVLVRPDCGFGKTIVAYSAALDAIRATGQPVLMLGNKGAAEGSLLEEPGKWEHTAGLRVVSLSGLTPKKRLAAWLTEADVYVASYGILKWLVEQLPKKFIMVVCDEASCLKGTKSAYRRDITILSKWAEYRIPMTATPKTGQEVDYFGIFKWMDKGERFGSKIGEFRALYMSSHKMQKGNTVWKMRNKKCIQTVNEIAATGMFDAPLEGKALVPIEETTCNFKLSPESQALYSQMEEFGKVDGANTREGKGGKPLGILEIKNYLTQLSSGFVYEETLQRITLADLDTASTAKLIKDNTTRTPRQLFDDRIKAMAKVYADVVKKHPDSTVLICYHYKYELAQLEELFPQALADTDPDFELLFNLAIVPVGLIQYQRSSKSLNLQSNCYVMIKYSQTFHFEDNYQIVRRIARQGQKAEKCFIYTLHFDGTADDFKTKKYEDVHMSHKLMTKLLHGRLNQ